MYVPKLIVIKHKLGCSCGLTSLSDAPASPKKATLVSVMMLLIRLVSSS